MRTYLGAAAQLTDLAMLPPEWCAGCHLLHLEGYVLYKPQFAKDAIAAARRRGSQACYAFAYI